MSLLFIETYWYQQYPQTPEHSNYQNQLPLSQSYSLNQHHKNTLHMTIPQHPINTQHLTNIYSLIQSHQFNQTIPIILNNSMNKQNKFVSRSNPFSTSHHKNNIHSDNSTLAATLLPLTQQQILSNNQHFEHLFETYSPQINSIKSISDQSTPYKDFKIIQNFETLKEMTTTISQTHSILFIRIFQQRYRSFKGFCTWASISTLDTCYLVDLISLRSSIAEQLGQKIFENPKILKIGLCLKQQVQMLQRDFEIFTRSLLDLKQLLCIWSYPIDLQSFIIQHFPKFDIPIIKQGNLYKRPCSELQLTHMCVSSSLLVHVLSHVKTKICQNRTILQACNISNKYSLEVYCCHLEKFNESLEKWFNSTKREQKSKRMLKKLSKWRIHTARIRDESPQYILPDSLIKLIISQEVMSMGELLELYDDHFGKQICRDYDQTILDIVNSKSSKIDIMKAQKQVNECEGLSDFLKLVGWNGCNWKEDNSESMRMFKQIISMDPIQSSILEDQLSQTKNRVLTNDEVLELFEYVPFFMKNDQKGLAEQHSKFMQLYKSRKPQDIQRQKSLQFDIPESLEQVYQLANQKKKTMKKDKKKCGITQQKQQPFVIDTAQFLKQIKWN